MYVRCNTIFLINAFIYFSNYCLEKGINFLGLLLLHTLYTLVNVYVDLLVFTRIAASVLHRPEVVDIGVKLLNTI